MQFQILYILSRITCVDDASHGLLLMIQKQLFDPRLCCKIDTQYRKFARVLLGFEQLLVGGWKERAEAVLGQALKLPLLQESVTNMR